MNEEGLFGSRYEARVLEMDVEQVLVQFSEFVSEEDPKSALEEWVDLDRVTPVPPPAPPEPPPPLAAPAPPESGCGSSMSKMRDWSLRASAKTSCVSGTGRKSLTSSKLAGTTQESAPP